MSKEINRQPDKMEDQIRISHGKGPGPHLFIKTNEMSRIDPQDVNQSVFESFSNEWRNFWDVILKSDHNEVEKNETFNDNAFNDLIKHHIDFNEMLYKTIEQSTDEGFKKLVEIMIENDRRPKLKSDKVRNSAINAPMHNNSLLYAESPYDQTPYQAEDSYTKKKDNFNPIHYTRRNVNFPETRKFFADSIIYNQGMRIVNNNSPETEDIGNQIIERKQDPNENGLGKKFLTESNPKVYMEMEEIDDQMLGKKCKTP